MPKKSEPVNPRFIPGCENSARSSPDKSDPMAFALFRKRQPDPVAPAAAPQLAHTEPIPVAETDSAREILELLELELGAMIRQLERAANSVAGGAEATA